MIGMHVATARRAVKVSLVCLSIGAAVALGGIGETQAQDKKPNFVVIMGDDIGMWNIGAYHRGMMLGKTPNIDKLAAEGAIFTDYYAEASCTAGRSNFITGELPIRTGLTTVGQAGARIGMPAEAPTIATALKDLGYATGQFGKNHLGDRNEYLPTVHGFDEFFGYLYHLDAMQDPFVGTMTEAEYEQYGPRNVLHTRASDVDDPAIEKRWGRVGMQTIEDKGPLPPHPTEGIEYNMETFDDDVLAHTMKFLDQARADGKPFFLWLNPTRMHIFTYLSPKYQALMTPENEWTIQESGMAQFDDIVGDVMQKLEDMGEADNTVIVVTTDNGTETFTWPDGGTTPFKGAKGMGTEGGFRVPAVIRWPGKVKPNQVINGMMSGLDWFPTFLTAAGNPTVKEDLLKGTELDGATYKVHLDGYDQTDMLVNGGESAREELFYFTQTDLSAIRLGNRKFGLLSQPEGWTGPTVKNNSPTIYNLRLDPFERMGYSSDESWMNFQNYYGQEFWRFVQMKEAIARLEASFELYPPMQTENGFDKLKAAKQQVQDAISSVSQ